MRYGTIVRYFPEKRFGFIRPDIGPDVFFHITALGACEPPEIKPGQAVKYELASSDELQARRKSKPAGGPPDSPLPPGRREAKLVELIDRIPGGSLDDIPTREYPRRHPRARRKKPTWRRPGPAQDPNA
jgi:cold shock CspA family protein